MEEVFNHNAPPSDIPSLPDNTDNSNLIPFKDLQTQLNTAPIRVWRAFVLLRKKGLFKHGIDWKHKHYTDKQNHFVNPTAYLEQVKELKSYNDIALKPDHTLSLITPPIPSVGSQPSGKLNTPDNSDNKSENTDTAYEGKYISQLESENERLIKEKGRADERLEKIDDRWDSRYGQLEQRFAMTFQAYKEASDERLQLRGELSELRLQLKKGAENIEQSNPVIIHEASTPDSVAPKHTPPDAELREKAPPQTPPESPQNQAGEEVGGYGYSVPSSESTAPPAEEVGDNSITGDPPKPAESESPEADEGVPIAVSTDQRHL